MGRGDSGAEEIINRQKQGRQERMGSKAYGDRITLTLKRKRDTSETGRKEVEEVGR